MSTQMTTRKEHVPAKSEVAVQRLVPRVDIYENNDEYLLVSDVPGVRAEDFELKLEKGRLDIVARQAPYGIAGLEAQPVVFERSFQLPEGIDTEKVDAGLEHGVLRIHLTKSARARTRRIEVQNA